MTLLLYPDGRAFATGVATYRARPTETPGPTRIILQILIGGWPVRAVVDTGAPYLICDPEVARDAGAGLGNMLTTETLIIRGRKYTGSLHRMDVEIPAEQGEMLSLDATVFVPQLLPDDSWDFPNFIGLTGALERMRFAVDPDGELFYFGPPA